MSMALSRSTAINSGNSEIQAANISKLSVQGQEASSSKTEGFFFGATTGTFEGFTRQPQRCVQKAKPRGQPRERSASQS